MVWSLLGHTSYQYPGALFRLAPLPRC
jgi:hypothetical protein